MPGAEAEAMQPSHSSNTSPEPTSGPQVQPVESRGSPKKRLNFPLEMFLELFKRFSPSTLQTAREVSWQFLTAADMTSQSFIHDLVVKPYDSSLFNEEAGYHRHHRWYLTNEYARSGDFVPRFPQVPQVPQVVKRDNYILKGLRRLAVLGSRSTDLVEILRSCVKLTQLEIDVFDFSKPEDDINLPRLRVLRVDSVRLGPGAGGRDSRLSFVSPNLSSLCLGEFP